MNKDKGLTYRGPRKLFQKAMPPMPKHVLCCYCKNAYANSWDHILPYSYGGTEHPENLVPCCRSCNSILSNKLFYGAEEKEYYIRLILKKKHTGKTAYHMVETRRSVGYLGLFYGLFYNWLLDRPKGMEKNIPSEGDMPRNSVISPSVALMALGRARLFGIAPERRVGFGKNKG